ncbi:hypothetical protein [Arthrobacter mobilis]|uniref:Uncharacterized protein n=1 Tax=Arthrobacter mobilis TaxID=2724944 RepID=A0A7X6K7F5_9MICC|nr:hypothetical protein [Arthrobacter mobilis]NKX56542.1 hypothetical protein [Arthrobacter mobilis]
MDKRIRDLLVRAEEEMIFIGPDHPSYELLAGLVASVRDAWQEGYEQGRNGGAGTNPYR